MILKPEDFLQPRFEFIKNYPNSPFNIGDILGSYEHDGILYLNTGDGVLQPRLFKDNFRELKWHEHRTIEQLNSIKYMKIVGDKTSYYGKGDIVEVIGMHYNDASFVGGRDNILFSLKGQLFSPAHLEPATKDEHDEFWENEKIK